MTDPDIVYTDDQLEVLRTVVGPMGNNVYLLRNVATANAVLIDAAAEGDELLEWAQAYGVTAVLTTHGHHDHIGAAAEFQAAGIPVSIGAGDADCLPLHDHLLTEADTIQLGNIDISVLATPGHTPGSTCFALQGRPLVFTGDTLFPGGPGATHFPGGDFDRIIESLQTELFTMSDGTHVFPGHGGATTIGAERSHLPDWVARRW